MDVSERRMRYKVDSTVSKPNSTAIDIRLLALYAGISEPRDELIKVMLDQDDVCAQALKVLSVVGFGGLGKTTLANEIYRKLEVQFQCQAFFSVSQKPNIRKILRSILSQAGYVAPDLTNMESWDEDQLIRTLRRFLADKRYFIVIDDIWDVTTWSIVRCALPENSNGGRVITTTRIETFFSKRRRCPGLCIE
ncbi:hypothetical protein ZWY2020_015701 [Hordeum vulgare]|nr:hypothetical protein ZWY2020_015701 [Hordeum vulgare]